jgi:hypothetical protein
MRSYRDAEAMAKALGASLAGRNVSLSHGECLQIVSQQLGVADDSLPHGPPASAECGHIPDVHRPTIAIRGDLKIMPVYIAGWRPGILSDPIELTGNGTYRIELTPVEPNEPVRQWITCRACGSPGSVLRVVLADVHERRLGSMALVTAAHTPGVVIFSRHGVMVESVPRSWNFSARAVNRG